MITLKTGWLSRVTSGKNHSQGVKRKHVSRARHLEMCTKVTSIIRRWGWYPSRYCGRGLGGWRHWLDWRWFATWDNSTLELLVRYCYLLFIMIYTNQTYMIYLYTWCCICLHMYIYIYISLYWFYVDVTTMFTYDCMHVYNCYGSTPLRYFWSQSLLPSNHFLRAKEDLPQSTVMSMISAGTKAD